MIQNHNPERFGLWGLTNPEREYNTGEM